MEDSKVAEAIESLTKEILDLKAQINAPNPCALTATQAAEALGGISTKTVKRLEYRGKIQRVRHIGRVLYTRKSVEELCNG